MTVVGSKHEPYYCDACGRNLTPTAEELQALSRWGNPLRRPPCLETESGYHLVDPEQITERQFADLVRDYAYVRRTRSCKCGYPKVACLRVVLGNGPPYPPPPCEPARSPSRTERGQS